eukprot:TRINITY_DN3158_c0_g2_i1.p1 TRINITY_DN3158_c0_g2~~TRINITY_DN3158_c0_g2_i1.p1  ORF type:complete len:132 (+),score=28.45 TRINITY_DN3158_c0_g2_i1:43-438(+)
MASEITHTQNDQPQLCIKCQKFYGSNQTNGYCSVCYKEVASLNPDLILSSIKEPNISPKIESAAKPIDLSRCAVCNKKVGYFGFKCHCERAFCSIHRYPDEHDCTFDFQADNKEKLVIQNPRVVTNRLNKL